ncbi:hypothetical protein GCM10009802_53360 [Streptomyces synnematoformans]|uniref:Uncharacterized protein n=1 Tax=Streptomyces synnematoformans TaxID=415721 RepID=A0ABN1ZHZ2_9ACTN
MPPGAQEDIPRAVPDEYRNLGPRSPGPGGARRAGCPPRLPSAGEPCTGEALRAAGDSAPREGQDVSRGAAAARSAVSQRLPTPAPPVTVSLTLSAGCTS